MGKTRKNKKSIMILGSVICLIAVIVVMLIYFFNKPLKYYLGTDLVKYNVASSGDFGFNLSMVYNKKNVSVEFVELLGENIENVSVEAVDDTFDDIKGKKYNGYYFKLLGFRCRRTGNDSYIKITAIRLKINGKENVFAFKTPIEMYLQEESSNSLLEIKNRPVIISTDSLEMMSYEYVYEAADDIDIIDFSFNNFFDISSVAVYVDNKSVGELKNLESIAVKKGQTVRFECKLGLKDGVSPYDNIACNFSIKHKKSETDKILEEIDSMTAQGVTSEENAKSVVKMLLETH